jgi:hypothetical protein
MSAPNISILHGALHPCLQSITTISNSTFIYPEVNVRAQMSALKQPLEIQHRITISKEYIARFNTQLTTAKCIIKSAVYSYA